MPTAAPTLTLLFDGLCPLCTREMRFMRRFDRHGRLVFLDIAAADFDPSRFGLTLPQTMAAMHGVLPDGTVIVGVEVFRRAYSAIGLGWLIGWTRWPIIRPIADCAYRAFARVRPRFSKLECDEGGRCGVRGGRQLR